MASNKNNLINSLNQKISQNEQFNRIDKRFKFDIEYIKENSEISDPSYDLLIESSCNNILFLVNNNKKIEYYGDAKFNNNVNIHGNTYLENLYINGNLNLDNNIIFNNPIDFNGDITFNSNIDISGSLTVNGIDNYSRTLSIESSILEYIPLTDGTPSNHLTIYDWLLDISNNPILSKLDDNILLTSDNSTGVTTSTSIKKYINTIVQNILTNTIHINNSILYKNIIYFNKNSRILNDNILLSINNSLPYHNITYGKKQNNIWLAGGIGNTHTLSFSTDSKSWIGLNNNIFSNAVYKIKYNGKIWVAVGEGLNNSIAYSFNGINWFGSKVLLGTSKNIFNIRALDIAYNKHKWVAVGIHTTHGMIAYSHDGINWIQSVTNSNTSILNLFSIQVTGVSWCSDKWIAIGEGTNTIAYSFNAIQWYGLGNILFDVPRSIFYNGEKVVIVASSGTYKIAYSVDCGYTWKGVNNLPNIDNLYGIIWDGKLWIGSGKVNNDISSGIIYSYDAINWYSFNIFSDLSNNYINNVIYDSENYFVCSKVLISNQGSTLKINDIDFFTNKYIDNNNLSLLINNSLITVEKNNRRNNIIDFNNKLIYACGNNTNSVLKYSYNAIDWYDVSGIVLNNCYNITYNNNIFIAYGNGTSGALSFSRDGIEWYNNIGTDVITNNINNICWYSNIFLAGSNGINTILYSYDGINWYAINNSNNIFSITCNNIIRFNNRWIAVGSGNSSIAYSDDGFNWIALGNTYFTIGNMLYSNDNIIFAVGQGTYSFIYSFDGINWVPIANSNSLLSIAYGVYYNNLYDVWVIVGEGTINRIIYSYDLITWTNVVNSNLLFSIRCRSITFNGNIWVASGEGNNTIGYSNNLLNWYGNGLSIFSNIGYSVMHFNKPIVSVQTPIFSLGSGINSFTYSLDGIQWKGMSNSIFNEAKAFATNGEFWLIGGTGGNSTMAYSYDAINWTLMGNNLFNVSCNTIVWNGNIWLAGGSGTNVFGYSYNGIDWNDLVLNFTVINHIFWNGKRFMIAGSGINTLAYSDDGLSWTYVNNSTNIFNIKAENLLWLKGRWYAVGNSINTIAYSDDDGLNWVGLGNSIFNNVGYGLSTDGNIIIATGDVNNVIAYSYDGLSWNGLGSNNLTKVGYGIVWTGKMFLVGGFSNNEADKSRLLISYNGINWYKMSIPHTNICYRFGCISDIMYAPIKKQINICEDNIYEFISDSYNSTHSDIIVKTNSLPFY